jgi:hypothetical protein
MREIRAGKRLEPEHFRPDVPSELGDIIRRATAADKRDRYATAGEMQLELERFLSDSGKVTTAHLLGEWLREGYPRERLDSADGLSTAAEEEGTPAQVSAPNTIDRASGVIEGDSGPTRVAPERGLFAADDARAPGARPAPLAPNPALVAGEVRPARSLLKPQPGQSHTDLVRPLDRGRLPWLAVGGALALLAGSGAFAWHRLGHRRGEDAPPAAALAVAPDPAIAVEKAQPARVAAPPDPAPGAKIEFAALDIATRPPRARLAIDGIAHARPTPVLGEAVAPGTHHLAILLPGYQRRELDVQLAAGERRSLDIELRPWKPIRAGKSAVARPTAAPGYLTVKTIPWSKVYEGPQLLGTTPFAGVTLAAGPHALTFVNPDRPSLTRRVVIKPGGEQRLSLELPK